jgi:hypothetical protein
MKVDITNTETKELLMLIRQFPKGKIIVEDEKAYWEFNTTDQPNAKNILNPQIPNTQIPNTQVPNTQIPPSTRIHDPVAKMRDYLFDSFS